MRIVHPKIFVGNDDDIKYWDEWKLTECGITAVVNLSDETQFWAPDKYETITCVKFNIIAGPGNKNKDFSESVDNVLKLLNDHNRIMTVCNTGRHRAPMVASAVACVLEGWKPEYAIDKIYEEHEDTQKENIFVLVKDELSKCVINDWKRRNK